MSTKQKLASENSFNVKKKVRVNNRKNCAATLFWLISSDCNKSPAGPAEGWSGACLGLVRGLPGICWGLSRAPSRACLAYVLVCLGPIWGLSGAHVGPVWALSGACLWSIGACLGPVWGMPQLACGLSRVREGSFWGLSWRVR